MRILIIYTMKNYIPYITFLPILLFRQLFNPYPVKKCLQLQQ